MIKKLLFTIPLLFVWPSCLFAQDKNLAIDDFIADIFEQYTAETEKTLDYESFYDDLISFSENKLNLNNAVKDDLMKLQFLSEDQVENILYYVYKFGPLDNLYQLQLIDGLDMTDIRYMLPFVRAGEGSPGNNNFYPRDLIAYGRHNIFLRVDNTLESKAGYQPSENENDTSKYIGSGIYNSVKYQYKLRDKIYAGITLEKDAGEPIFSRYRNGYDFYSFYTQVNRVGIFKTIILGDFRASFGQGLVLGSTFSSGPSSYVLNVANASVGLRKSSSSNEFAFFRGLGGTLQKNNFMLSAFYSYRIIDADAIDSTFSGFYKTGYHRTLSELNKKHSVNQQTLGVNGNLRFKYLSVGLTLNHTFFDKELIFNKTVYNLFYFCGVKQTAVSMDYRARFFKLNFFGETALADNLSVATLNGISFSPASKISFVTLFRYYSPKYDELFASSFSQNSKTNNETGIYSGIELKATKGLKISFYVDAYKYPWPKYIVSSPSTGNESLFQADYMPQKSLAMFLRLKYSNKQVNVSDDISPVKLIVDRTKFLVKYQLLFKSGNWKFKNVNEINQITIGKSRSTYGFLAYQDVSYDFRKIPLNFNLRYLLFDAVDFENAFYTYESDVLYAFSIPMFYGKGNRYYFNLKYELSRHYSVWFKISQIVYADDRTAISSGNEKIIGNRKTEFRFLLRMSY